MVEVSVTGGQVRFEVIGLDKFWAFKSRIDVPAQSITGARQDPEAARRPRGWRLPGTSVPGIVRAGSYYGQGQRVFWDVWYSHLERVIVVELQGQRYSRLIIEVPDPAAALRTIEAARAGTA